VTSTSKLSSIVPKACKNKVKGGIVLSYLCGESLKKVLKKLKIERGGGGN
jgi:hypothetical protein